MCGCVGGVESVTKRYGTLCVCSVSAQRKCPSAAFSSQLDSSCMYVSSCMCVVQCVYCRTRCALQYVRGVCCFTRSSSQEQHTCVHLPRSLIYIRLWIYQSTVISFSYPQAASFKRFQLLKSYTQSVSARSASRPWPPTYSQPTAGWSANTWYSLKYVYYSWYIHTFNDCNGMIF